MDARGMQMFQQGTKVYIHDTRKDDLYVSSGHAQPRAPASTGGSDFTHSVGGALGGPTRGHHANALGIGVAGAAASICGD